MELDPHRGTIFSYVMNNYWHTNYVAGQGGDFTFRYVLTSGEEPGARPTQPVGVGRDDAPGDQRNHCKR